MEQMAVLRLQEFMTENNILWDPDFVGFVKHKEAKRKNVYGAIWNYEGGLILQLHKWTEVNKKKSVPKVCAEIQYTHKLTDKQILNSFEYIDQPEYLALEILDYQSLSK